MKEISKINADILGKDITLMQTIEECGELIQAISKYNRTRGIGQKTEVTEEEALHNLIVEVTDVSICIEQIIYLLNIEDDVLMYKEDAQNKVYNRYKDEIEMIKNKLSNEENNKDSIIMCPKCFTQWIQKGPYVPGQNSLCKKCRELEDV